MEGVFYCLSWMKELSEFWTYKLYCNCVNEWAMFTWVDWRVVMFLKQIHCANLQAATIMALSATEICLLQTLKIDMLYWFCLCLFCPAVDIVIVSILTVCIVYHMYFYRSTMLVMKNTLTWFALAGSLLRHQCLRGKLADFCFTKKILWPCSEPYIFWFNLSDLAHCVVGGPWYRWEALLLPGVRSVSCSWMNFTITCPCSNFMDLSCPLLCCMPFECSWIQLLEEC
jgi:hypothetical protein